MVPLRGEIDHSVTNELTEALLSYGSVTRPRTVVDLSGVTFMDSSAINALIAAHQGMSALRDAAYRGRPGISAAGP
ncbi:STAS domain-containing protein [Streptomyces sp. NPDC102259]|uniref:STAS domain-containing protein n=1 Tax=Streptomyces sp. NPDC102259 TaxID=3366148 RepID=UPI0037FC7AF4